MQTRRRSGHGHVRPPVATFGGAPGCRSSLTRGRSPFAPPPELDEQSRSSASVGLTFESSAVSASTIAPSARSRRDVGSVGRELARAVGEERELRRARRHDEGASR